MKGRLTNRHLRVVGVVNALFYCPLDLVTGNFPFEFGLFQNDK